MSSTPSGEPGRAIVTGGAGFIGCWVVAELLRREYAVIAFDDLSSGSADNLAQFKGHPGFEGLIVADVKNADQVAALLHDEFDVCFHLAASINVQQSIEDPRKVMENDILGTFNVLEAARSAEFRIQNSQFRNGRPKVVIVSTCMVYAPSESPIGIDEHYPVRALSPYAACKLAGEHLALSYHHCYGLPVTVLRPFNTYGPYQKTNQEGGVVAVFVRRALCGEPLLVKGDGRQTRDLLYVKDCARFIVMAGLDPASNGMILNAGSGDDITIRALADKIAAGGCEVRHVPHDHPQAEIGKLVCDNARARQVLGWLPEYDLDAGLAETREWIAARVPHPPALYPEGQGSGVGELMSKLSYGRQWIDETDIAAVAEALRGALITQGPIVRQFEQRVAEYCGAKHAIAVSSGTAALHVAALACGIGAGDVGLTSPLTFLASANCIAYTGARVDFVDISPETLCLDVDAVERRCPGEPRGLPPRSSSCETDSRAEERGDKPRGSLKLVVAVDFAGVPCDLPRLFDMARCYGFTLIEDAAHSLGASYRHEGHEYRCGGCAHAHMATLSFHPVKAITTGEGGLVLTNDDALADRVRRLACHGIERNRSKFSRDSKRSAAPIPPDPELSRDDGPWYHEMQELGFNYRITEFQCALGLSQMDKLDGWIARRREIAARYNEAFRDLAEIPPWPDHVSPAFHLYVLRLTRRWRDRRREFFDLLVERGIQPQVHYIPVHLQPYYCERFGFERGDFPTAEDVYERCLSLPLYPALSDEEVNRVIDAVRGLLK